MALFSYWFAAMSAAREKHRGTAVPPDADGLGILTRLTGGTL